MYVLISHVRDLKLRRWCNSAKITDLVNGRAWIQPRKSGFVASVLNMFCSFSISFKNRILSVSQLGRTMQSVPWVKSEARTTGSLYTKLIHSIDN